MAFGGQMHDGVGLVAREDVLHRGRIGDIGAYQLMALSTASSEAA
jgi:hypothetical protein